MGIEFVLPESINIEVTQHSASKDDTENPLRTQLVNVKTSGPQGPSGNSADLWLRAVQDTEPDSSTWLNGQVWLDTKDAGINIGIFRRWNGSVWCPDRPKAIKASDYNATAWWSALNQNVESGIGLNSIDADSVIMTGMGNLPVYRSAGINGLPSIEFNNGRFVSEDPFLNLGEEWTIMILAQPSAANENGMAVMFGEEAALKRRAIWIEHRNSINFSGYNANVISNSGIPQAAVITVTRQSNGYITIRKNGVEVGSGTPGLNPYAYNGFSIGANVSGSEQFTGMISEFAVWDTPPNISDVVELENAWKGQYLIG